MNFAEVIESFALYLESEYRSYIDELCEYAKNILCLKIPNIIVWKHDSERYELAWYGKFYIIIAPKSDGGVYIHLKHFNPNYCMKVFDSFEELFAYLVTDDIMKPYFKPIE